MENGDTAVSIMNRVARVNPKDAEEFTVFQVVKPSASTLLIQGIKCTKKTHGS